MLPLPALLGALLLLAGCGGADGFSSDVSANFLDACVENAVEAAGAQADEEQLAQTCRCVLERVEQEYSEDEFGAFEERLVDGTASDEESERLATWSSECTEETRS